MPRHEQLNQASWNQNYSNYLLSPEGVSQEVLKAVEGVSRDEFTEFAK